MTDPDAELDAYLRAERVANDYHRADEHPAEVTVLHDAAALLRTGPGTAAFAAEGCARLLEEVARCRRMGHAVSPELAQAADEIARQVVGSGPTPPAS